MTADRLAACFTRAAAEERAALVTYLMAGDPEVAQSLEFFRTLIRAGADVVEIGVPFTDPMAEGITIQGAAQRALAAHTTLSQILELVGTLRAEFPTTPLILMGYANPFYRYGATAFCRDAQAAGVDGLIVVDLPPEEDAVLCVAAGDVGLHFIRLATPTTDEARLPMVLRRASGFVYYVSITGITGAAAPEISAVAAEVARLKQHTALPIAVGFGIKTPEQARALAGISDGVVVGSALVQCVADHLDDAPAANQAVAQLTQSLKAALSRPNGG